MRTQFRRVQRGHDGADIVRPFNLQRRGVDRDDDFGTPLRGVRAGLKQHPVADRIDHADFLGDGDEHAGRNHAARRMAPARQRLHADDDAIAGGDDRLVMDRQLALIDSGAKILLELHPLMVIALHVGVVLTDTIAAPRLGRAEREIGAAHGCRQIAT